MPSPLRALATALTVVVVCVATTVTAAATPAVAGALAGPGQLLLWDDFSDPQLDTALWHPGLHQNGVDNNGVVPANLSLGRVDDAGESVTVLIAGANGDRYTGPVRGVRRVDNRYPIGDPRGYQRQPTGARTGGLVWTNQRFGPGRYEVRMKVLPDSGGCSCIWNYYDPTHSVVPQRTTGGSYTEIDIEVPAHDERAGLPGAPRRAGFNTFTGPHEADATVAHVDLTDTTGFHVYRFDWYAGSDGGKRVDFYVDGVRQASHTTHVPETPAQLWVGNWPAPWSGRFDYDTQYLYVDWVRISALPGTRAPG